ncbi:MAG: L-asparaginase [Verrucomicrobiales bacterium]|jgi:L-asparaginase
MLILATGGTIDKVYFDANSEYEVGESIVSQVFADVGARLDYRLVSLMRKDSLEITAEDRKLIRAECESAAENRIVITHGTDTMTQTAEAIMGIAGKTIVLTGSLTPARFRSTDAVFNLGCALGAAASAGAGVYVAMHGRVFEAGKVRKNRAAGRFEDL